MEQPVPITRLVLFLMFFLFTVERKSCFEIEEIEDLKVQ
jgi:hypothetical protein